MGSNLIVPNEISCDDWMGGFRHKFMFNGREARIVEPKDPLPGKLWFWVPEWPDAFPERNGVRDLLHFGYYMIHINVRGLCGNPEAVEIMKSMYDYVQTLGFAKKAAFIGMSLGGLYSFRYGAKYPETVACIYADAPAVDLTYRTKIGRADVTEMSRAYGLGDNTDGLKDHPLSPANNYMPMVKAGIPLLMILGMADSIVPPEDNGKLVADRWKAAGGKVKLIERPLWGHHPHGLDDTTEIVRFVLCNTLNEGDY